MTTVAGKLDWLNSLKPEKAREELLRCCGSGVWVDRMLKQRPFRSETELYAHADREWAKVAPKDILEAFSHHPKIGDVTSLRTKFASTGSWASKEQSGVNHAPEKTLEEIARLNEVYLEKFGYIFIICATGKSAAEMLRALETRANNLPEMELKIAAEEQRKITRLRLEKLVRI
jgi:2-oxo-4-hydroxy-4-carboxy-5-ureidoimidazoline decarboxylase